MLATTGDFRARSTTALEPEMTTRILLGLSLLLAGSSMAAAQNAVPAYPDTKVIPIQASVAAKPGGGDMQQQLTTNLAKAGYTNVKIEPDAFIVGATNKSGEKVVMFLSPDSATVFTAMDPKGEDARTAPSTAPKGSGPK
jgi:hypothetical protein